jgi:hypothetical protein
LKSVVEERFSLKEWNEMRQRNEHPQWTANKGFEKIPEFSYFRSNGSKDYYSAEFPYQDLFVLQMGKRGIDWTRTRVDLMDSQYMNLEDMKSIATEFNLG